MKKIRIPHTDLDASQIAFGCMTIGGEMDHQPLTDQDRQEASNVIHAALDQGINFFDHADIYRYGKSEEVFSTIWQESPGLREKIILQTKCGIRFAGDPHEDSPHRFDFSYDHITRSVEGSLRRLKTDWVDILLLHRPDPLVEPEEVARAFDDLKTSGKVRYFGVSNHTAAQIELLRRYLNQPLVANQVELNPLHVHLLDEGIVFNQDNPPTPVRGEGTLEYCRQHDIGIQLWRPLAKGYLTGRPVENPSERIVRAAQVVADLAQEKNVSGEAILIAWLLRHPAGFQPIFGSTNPDRVRAACQASTFELTREEWYRLFTAGRGAALP